MAERAAGVRSGTRRRRLLTAGGLVLAVGLVWLVAFSSLISVRHVEVEGSSTALRGQVQAAADPALGRPLLRAGGNDVRARVQGLRQVEQVRVSRSFPSTLVVHVTPRTPVLAVSASDHHHYLVDESGLVYSRVDKAPGQVPSMTVRQRLSLGQRQPSLGTLATVMGSLSASQRAGVAHVSVARTGDVAFDLGPLQVRWGGAEQTPLKARTLRALAPTIAKEHPTAIDLSAPGRPIIS